MKRGIKLQNLKGTTEYLPNEQASRDIVIQTLKNVFEKYGFLPVETPILCSFELLSSKYAGGAEILKEVYKLKDQGERDLGLRYDLTVPFARMISANQSINLPFKRYEIGKVFRNGPVKKGRCREFTQCDVDVCGIRGRLIEAEFFQMAEECFSKLNLEIEIKWSNRKYLSGLIDEAGINCNLSSKFILAVDKLEKIGYEQVYKELLELGISEQSVNKFFELSKLNIQQIKEKASSSILKEGCEEVLELDKIIKDLNLKSCVFSPTLARGLEIYTGTVWEIFDRTGKITSSLGGGGRYDEIIGKFIGDGNTYPAVGMSFGLEPITVLTKDKKENNSIVDVSIFSFNKNAQTLKIAKILRDECIKTTIDFNHNKLKKFLETSSNLNIPYVLIIGEDEIKENKVTIRNLKKSEQKTCSLTEAINIIKKGK